MVRVDRNGLLPYQDAGSEVRNGTPFLVAALTDGDLKLNHYRNFARNEGCDADHFQLHRFSSPTNPRNGLAARSQAPRYCGPVLWASASAQPAQTFQTLLASRPLIGPKQLVFTIRQLRLAFLPVNPREDIMDSIQRRVQLSAHAGIQR